MKGRIGNPPTVFTKDVAKQKQYALLRAADDSVFELIHWQHPRQTREVLYGPCSLDCRMDVVTDSTDTYGDTLCYRF